MNDTSKSCSCGEKLYKFFLSGRKRGCGYELICWKCGLIYKQNKKLVKVTSEGIETKVGNHNIEIGA